MVFVHGIREDKTQIHSIPSERAIEVVTELWNNLPAVREE